MKIGSEPNDDADYWEQQDSIKQNLFELNTIKTHCQLIEEETCKQE